MKILLVVFFLGGWCMVANTQENAATIQIKLITSMVNVSSEQYQRAMDYINEYYESNRLLSEVTGFLTTNLDGVLDMTVVRSFLSEIQSHLTNNVQQLIINYSPESIRAFIFSYFTTFTTNIVTNTGAFNELNDLTLLYISKILDQNSTNCMSKHAEDILEIYSNAASGFIKVMEEDVGTTVSQLEIYRAEINTMIRELTSKLQEISSNRTTALVKFGEFLTGTNGTINQIDTWIVQFGGLMKQTQNNIKDGFKQFDGGRVNNTLTLVKKTSECLSSL